MEQINEYYKVVGDSGSYTIYSKAFSGKCYRQHFNYWAKGGYDVPQSRKKCTSKEYEQMKAVAVGFNGAW